MVQDGRRIRPIEKKSLFGAIKGDPIRMLELALVALGSGIATLSAFFSWQAASAAKEQATYAHEALYKAEENSTFRTYIASWNKLCRAIAPEEEFLSVGIPELAGDGHLTVTATNLGFDPAIYDSRLYVDRVVTAENAVKDNLLEFRTFLPGDVFPRTEQAIMIIGYFYQTPSSTGDNRRALQNQIIKAAALCNYYTEEQMKWFKDRSHKIKPIVLLLDDMKIDYTSDFNPAPMGR